MHYHAPHIKQTASTLTPPVGRIEWAPKNESVQVGKAYIGYVLCIAYYATLLDNSHVTAL